MKAKDKVAWECKHCGHCYLWKWGHGEAKEGLIWMDCEKCNQHTQAHLVRIGSRLWVATWNNL